MIGRFAPVGALILALVLAAFAAAGAEVVEAGRFSAMMPGGLPLGWHVEDFLSHEEAIFALVRTDAGVVVEGRADASAAALARDLVVNPAEFPVIRWRWKTERLVAATDPKRRAGDDYAARLYVSFDYDVRRLSWPDRAKVAVARMLYGDRVPTATLCYVWDGGRPAGTINPSPYTDRVRMLVAEGGAARVGQWVTLERNVLEDFRAAFGEEAPRITGIAIALDTDNTGESARTYFGDIEFLK